MYSGLASSVAVAGPGVGPGVGPVLGPVVGPVPTSPVCTSKKRKLSQDGRIHVKTEPGMSGWYRDSLSLACPFLSQQCDMATIIPFQPDNRAYELLRPQ